MARPGIILYGYDPSDEVRFGQFRPVMTLKTDVYKRQQQRICYTCRHKGLSGSDISP